jgi:crossover junction endodeoxyribonuclease RuvC
MEKIVLSLDLGTVCGWCLGTPGSHVSGTWNLKPDKYEGGGMRYLKFRQKLDEIAKSVEISQVVYEAVRKHRGTDAAHIYGGLMGCLTEWCEFNGIPYEGVPVGTIKKHWTGNGAATKEMMLAECEEREIVVSDDNEADAVALHDYIVTKLKSEAKQLAEAVKKPLWARNVPPSIGVAFFALSAFLSCAEPAYGPLLAPEHWIKLI